MKTQTRMRSYADPQGWGAQGACRHSDPELFFPIAAAGPAAGQADRAKKVCAGCPVRRLCLEYALETGQGFGIWGGTTETERRKMSRRLRHGDRPSWQTVGHG